MFIYVLRSLELHPVPTDPHLSYLFVFEWEAVQLSVYQSFLPSLFASSVALLKVYLVPPSNSLMELLYCIYPSITA